MRSILRFLCVVIMLQVSTPLVHGMAEEDLDIETGEEAALLDRGSYGERVARFWPSERIKKLFRYECTKVMCAILAAGAIAGCAYPFINQLLQKDPAASSLFAPRPMCVQDNWDRREAVCTKWDQDIPGWAISMCQERIMEGECVPVCNDFSSEYNFQITSWYNGEFGWYCSSKLNLTADDYPVCFRCSYEAANELIELGIPFCPIDIEPGFDIVGVVIPHSSLHNVNFTAYEKQIVGQAEDMEEEAHYCKQAADYARQAVGCRGPIAYNANSTSSTTPKKPKKSIAKT